GLLHRPQRPAGSGARRHHQGRAAGHGAAGRAPPSRPHRRRPIPRPTSEAIARAAMLIDAAERPLIFAGHGIVASGSSTLVREFAEKTGVPVTSTLLGLGGFPASHPLSLGMMGMHGEAWVNASIQEADLLIA